MAEAYLTTGATSLNAANWSDATGFADDAELVIRSGSQNITQNLDRRGDTTDTTGGIHYLRVTAGFTGTLGGAAGSALVEFETAAGISRPNYHQSGGTVYLNPATNACDSALVDGGTLYLTGTGTVTKLVVQGSARVIVGESITTTTLIVSGGFVELADGAAVTTLRNIGGNVYTHRHVTTAEIDAGTFTFDTGTDNFTTVRNGGGRVVALTGDVATYNGFGGVLDLRTVKETLTIGTSATVLYPTAVILGENNTDVTVANVTREGSYTAQTIGLPGGNPLA